MASRIETCIDSQKLIQYVEQRLHQNDSRNVITHLTQCAECQKKFRQLKGIERILIMDDEKIEGQYRGQMDKKDCIPDERFYEYLDGRLGEREAKIIERHLNLCPDCFRELASFIRNTSYPITDSELAELFRIKNLSRDEQVTNIISIAEKEEAIDKKGKPIKPSLIFRLWEKLKSLFATKFLLTRQVKFAGAFACGLILILLVGLPQYKHWQSHLLADEGISHLAEAITIADEDQLRPVGGFKFSIIGTTRSLEFDNKLVSVKEKLEKALRLNHQNASAFQYLGTYFLRAEIDLEKARYYYQLAYSQDSTNASILNDLGVLASDQHDYEGAIDLFRKALKYNPHLIEAQYNLVKSYGILGQSGKASQEMRKYKELEPELNWSDVAEKSIEQLKK